MGELTAEVPKALLAIGGRRLVEIQLEALRGAGVSPIAVATGYQRESLRAWGDREFHNPRWSETNMVATLLAAESWFDDRPVIVSYADIFYCAETVRRLAETTGDIVISYDPDWLTLWRARFADPLSDAERFRRRQDGSLAEIGGKSATIDVIEGQYLGLFKLTRRGLAAFREVYREDAALTRDRLDVTAVLRRLLDRGATIATSPVVGRWGEVDSPEDLALYASWGSPLTSPERRFPDT